MTGQVGQAPPQTLEGPPQPFSGGGGRGMGPAPQELAPPPVSAQFGGEPMEIGQQLQPPPPAYTPWYTPEEISEMKAREQGAQSEATIRAQINARKRIGEEMGLKGDALTRYSLGQAGAISRYQSKAIVDPANPAQPLFVNFDPATGDYIDPDTNEVIPDAKPWTWASSPSTVWRATLEATMAAGGTMQEALDKYNTRYSESTGFMVKTNKDGSTELVPVTRGTVTTKTAPESAGGQKITPPPAKTTGAGEPFGGKVPPEVKKSFDNYNQALERFAVMEDAYPKALKGDQQAMLNILANHIGMTMGLQKGSRITQAIYNEAETASPLLGRILARFDARGYLQGVVLTPEQMGQMVELAKVRRDQDKNAYDRVRTEVGRGYSLEPPPGAKTASRADVQAYASQFKITYDEAKKAFTDDGYTVE
jgi:hypothetical protein